MVNLFDLGGALRDEASKATGPLHVRAFASWLLDDERTLRALVGEAATSDQQRHPEHIASLGYASAMGLLSNDEQSMLAEDLVNLSGRSYFASGRPWRFELDGVALLGIALAVRAGNVDGQWLLQVLERSASELVADEWNIGLVRAARVVLGADEVVQKPDLAVALCGKGIGSMPQDLENAWRIATELDAPEMPDRAAARLRALEELTARSSYVIPRAATLDDLIAVLEGSARSLRRWPYGSQTPKSMPAIWEIDNEYNVQDMLWAILAPLFPDLEDEENLPSLGPKHPRADLAVPRLRTIIEVKYLRRDRQSDRAKIVEEVAADTGLYLSKSHEYDSIIAYIWDDAAQTDQHHELRMGIEAIPGIARTIIVPRPPKMDRSRLED